MANDIVQVEYDQLAAICQQFTAHAERIEQMQSTLQNNFAPLEAGDWEGKGAGAFFNKMNNSILPSVQHLQSGLLVARDVTQQVMQIFQQAEQEAAQLFCGGKDEGSISKSDNGVTSSGSFGESQPRSWWDRGVEIFREGERRIREGTDQITGVATSVARDVIAQTDALVRRALEAILPLPPADGTESIKVETTGDMTVPGAELGLPVSLTINGARSVEIIRNPDGTYSVKVTNAVGAGITADSGKGELTATAGSETVGGSTNPSASGSATVEGEQTVTFTFDPNKPGDMTELAALAASLGVPGFPPTAAGPIMATLQDNVTSIESNVGLNVEGTISGPLGEITGNGGVITGVKTNADGQTEVTYGVEGGVSGSVKVGDYDLSGGVSAKVEGVYNTTTGTTQTVVTVTVTHPTPGDLAALQATLPAGASIGLETNGTYTITYTADGTPQQVANTVMPNGVLDINAVRNAGDVEVKHTDSTSLPIEVKGSIGEAGQSLGVGAGVEITRESEHQVYP